MVFYGVSWWSGEILPYPGENIPQNKQICPIYRGFYIGMIASRSELDWSRGNGNENWGWPKRGKVCLTCVRILCDLPHPLRRRPSARRGLAIRATSRAGRQICPQARFFGSVVLGTTIGVLSVYGANNSLIGRRAFSACFNYSLNCNFRNSWQCSQAVLVEISTFWACHLFGACRHVINKICDRTQKMNACRRSGADGRRGSAGAFFQYQKKTFSPSPPASICFPFFVVCSAVAVRVHISAYCSIVFFHREQLSFPPASLRYIPPQ